MFRLGLAVVALVLSAAAIPGEAGAQSRCSISKARLQTMHSNPKRYIRRDTGTQPFARQRIVRYRTQRLDGKCFVIAKVRGAKTCNRACLFIYTYARTRLTLVFGSYANDDFRRLYKDRKTGCYKVAVYSNVFKKRALYSFGGMTCS